MSDKKKILLIGANGLIGGHLLTLLLNDNHFYEVITWSRSPIGLTHSKLKEKIIDFASIKKNPAEKFDILVCCLGTTINKAKSKDAFYKVDHDYVVDLAMYAEKSGISKFIVVSSIGADKNSSNFYLRTKGEMENDISNFNIPGIAILRPSILFGKRKEFRFGEILGKGFMHAIGFLFIGKLKKYKGIHAQTVAEAILILARKDIPEKIILESDQIVNICRDK